MSRCDSRRGSSKPHAEYGKPLGFRPRSSGARPSTALSKPALASSHASARASCSRSAAIVDVDLMTFEELDRALVLFRGRARRERAEVPALPRFRIVFPRIQAILPRAQLPDHVPNPLFRSTV